MEQQDIHARRSERGRTILAAQAVLGKGLADVTCQIKDISDTGARIFIDEGIFLPPIFELRVPKRNASYRVQIRWREGHFLGVEFLPERREIAGVDPLTRILELEAENARLRRRLAEMADRLFSYGESEQAAS